MSGISKAAFTSLVLTGVLCTAGQPHAQPASIPNFTLVADSMWVPDRPAGDDFLPPESGPGPVTSDSAHAYSPLAQAQGQLQFHIADLGNPILKPWAVEQMKQANDDVL